MLARPLTFARSGYHKNKKATDETINQDKWMMTGDVCVRAPDGNFSIVDRTKELIKYKGARGKSNSRIDR